MLSRPFLMFKVGQNPKGCSAVLILLALLFLPGFAVEPLWVARYNGPANGLDLAYAIAVDSWGNSYVTGMSIGMGTRGDYVTIKYDPEGHQQWLARYNTPWNGADGAIDLCCDRFGNLFVTGTSAQESMGIYARYDYATIKYRCSTGEQVWVARYDRNGQPYSTDEAQALAVDSCGNVYVTGSSYNDENSSDDVTTVKYDSNGTQKWVTFWDSGIRDVNDRGKAIKVDGQGNVFVTGSGMGGIYFVTTKCDSAGNNRWVALDSGSGGEALVLDRSGNVYVFGSRATENWLDYRTVKYDSSGHLEWVREYNGPGNGDDWPSAMTIDDSGYIYVTGTSKGAGTMEDVCTIKYDSAGNELWVARYNGPAGTYDGGRGIATDGKFVYVAGDCFVARWVCVPCLLKYYCQTGELDWVAIYQAPDSVDGWFANVALDHERCIVVTGSCFDSLENYDYLTAKYRPDGQAIAERASSNRLANTLALWANPAKAAVLFRGLPFEPGSVRVSLFDASGRAVLSQKLARDDTGAARLDLPSLSAGVYLVRVSTGTSIATTKLVVR